MKNVLKSLVVATTVVLMVVACSKTLYVPYTPTETDATKSNTSVDVLNKGMAVYTNNCAKCHSIVPPDKHTKAEWDKILPRMSKKAKLAATDAESLSLYVHARAKELVAQ